MTGFARIAAGAAVLFGIAASATAAQAATKMSFILNWIAGGDHAPYYYAQKMGWYKDAGIDLEIEQGKGSSLSAQRVGVGKNELGLADLPNVFVTIAKGADTVAVMNIYANSPYGFYWLKSSGIKTPKDFAGKKIGNPPFDAARQMWPAYAKNVGIDPKGITWVNVQPNAKLSALKSGAIDITTSFYNIHHIFQRELGDDMGFSPGKEYDVNPYGNSIIVSAKYLEANRDAVAAFVKVSQKAFHDCALNAKPCIDALVEANKGLQAENETTNWALVKELMTDETSTTKGLGYMDPERMKKSYDVFAPDLEKQFDYTKHFTNALIDTSIKMPK